MPADAMILIYGRPFDAPDERALGHGPAAALEALAAAHPDLVHRPSEPGGGAWWIGREFRSDVALVLPLRLDRVSTLRAELPPVPIEDQVDHFCEALPEALRDHPRLRPAAVYLIRKGR